MKKREVLASIADKSGLLTALSGRSLFRKKSVLTILAYHRIFKDSISSDCHFDDNLLSATQDDFDNQVSWLKKNFEVITFGQLKCLKTAVNNLILTFDDGYRDNYDLAFPVLKRHGVKATIFLSTGYIGNNDMFWWDEIAYMIKKTSVLNFTVTLDRDYKYALVGDPDKKYAIASLNKLAKLVSNEDRLRLLEQLKVQLGISVSVDVAKNLILDWNKVREMSSGGIEFGAHSVTHPILANMHETEARLEIENSKKDIERNIDKEVTVFSYPVGGSDRFNATTKDLVKKAGYSYSVSYIHGVNYYSNLDHFCLKRIHVEKNDTFSTFKAKILLPNVIKY